jgi:hypothetical protein
MFQEFSCAHSRCHFMRLFLGPQLCETTADCSKELHVEDTNGNDATLRLAGCVTDQSLPPGVKSCRYR